MNTIPTVNFADFISDDADRKARFVQELGKAYQEVGFVAVQNHGIDQQLVDGFYNAVESFFAMPDDIKSKYEIAGLAGQRGFTSFGKEHAKQRPCRHILIDRIQHILKSARIGSTWLLVYLCLMRSWRCLVQLFNEK